MWGRVWCVPDAAGRDDGQRPVVLTEDFALFPLFLLCLWMDGSLTQSMPVHRFNVLWAPSMSQLVEAIPSPPVYPVQKRLTSIALFGYLGSDLETRKYEGFLGNMPSFRVCGV